jgi:hypothetical protein
MGCYHKTHNNECPACVLNLVSKRERQLKAALRKPIDRWKEFRTSGHYLWAQLEELLNEIEQILDGGE